MHFAPEAHLERIEQLEREHRAATDVFDLSKVDHVTHSPLFYNLQAHGN